MNVTLDVNQLIALENNYLQATDIRELISMHDRSEIVLQVCAMSASEKQRGDKFLHTFNDFKSWIATLDLNRTRVLFPLCYTDISFWDTCLLGGWGTNVLEVEIHKILFGSTDISFNFESHRKRYETESQDKQREEYFRWRNAKCDVQSFWSHMVAGGGLFVSDDGNFHKASKKPELVALAGGDILRPGDAIAFVKSGKTLTPPPFDVAALVEDKIDKDAVPQELKHYSTWRSSVQSRSR